MILEKTFGFPVEEGLYEKVYDILKNEFGLVDGRGNSSTGNYRVLVWEDEKGIGRFRVHCYGNRAWKIPNDGKKYDTFNFHYWTSPKRFDRDVFSKEPMNAPLQRILALSDNRYDTNHLFLEQTIEEFDKSLGAQK
jgi:hypothetical protein